MLQIRLERIYFYYLHRAEISLKEANAVKDAYLQGSISYRRALKDISKHINLMQQSLRVCDSVSFMSKNFYDTSTIDLQKKLFNLISWVEPKA